MSTKLFTGNVTKKQKKQQQLKAKDVIVNDKQTKNEGLRRIILQISRNTAGGWNIKIRNT